MGISAWLTATIPFGVISLFRSLSYRGGTLTTGTLIEFLGWASAINIALLGISSMGVIVLWGPISRLHSPWFGVDEKDVGRASFHDTAHLRSLLDDYQVFC